MTGEPRDNIGTGGSTANFGQWSYPAVPYTAQDFNWPHCIIDGWDYGCCPDRVSFNSLIITEPV